MFQPCLPGKAGGLGRDEPALLVHADAVLAQPGTQGQGLLPPLPVLRTHLHQQRLPPVLLAAKHVQLKLRWAQLQVHNLQAA